MTPSGRGSVFLLTDYGVDDEFAGLTRAVILRAAPKADVVDLSHGVPPFDVRAGALMLSRSVRYLGPGVVMAVVDPGVGSGRKAVALSVPPGPGPRFLLGPDNGLLMEATRVLGGVEEAVVLPPAAPSGTGTGAGTGPGTGADRGPTFDGRDLFAPVAAALWSGATLGEVGSFLDPGSLVELPPAHLKVQPDGPGSPGSIEAEVIWVDRFGNAQLSARASDGSAAGLVTGGGEPGTAIEIRVGESTTPARFVRAFSELGPGESGLMVDSNGHLALVSFLRPAATVLGVGSGDRVILSR